MEEDFQFPFHSYVNQVVFISYSMHYSPSLYSDLFTTKN